MGTRSNIRITGDKFSVMLYRHWDGYPSTTGHNLAMHLSRMIRQNTRNSDIFSDESPGYNASRFTNKLLRQFHVEELRGQVFDYEITNNIHGDIEWLYAVKFMPNGSIRIIVTEYSGINGPDNSDGDEWYRGKLAGFRVKVARELRAMRARIADYDRRQAARSTAKQVALFHYL